MKLNGFERTDRAVSPVVGVALLIAMTVILAGVISFVVMGLGSEPASSPQASFEFSYNSTAGAVTATHDGGDAIPTGEIQVLVDGADQGFATAPSGETWTAGERATISASAGDEVRLVWNAPDSDKTTTLATFDV